MTDARDPVSPHLEHSPTQDSPAPGSRLLQPASGDLCPLLQEWGGESCLPVASDIWDGVVHGVVEQRWGQPRCRNNGHQNWQQLLPTRPPACAPHRGLHFHF